MPAKTTYKEASVEQRSQYICELASYEGIIQKVIREIESKGYCTRSASGTCGVPVP